MGAVWSIAVDWAVFFLSGGNQSFVLELGGREQVVVFNRGVRINLHKENEQRNNRAKVPRRCPRARLVGVWPSRGAFDKVLSCFLLLPQVFFCCLFFFFRTLRTTRATMKRATSVEPPMPPPCVTVVKLHSAASFYIAGILVVSSRAGIVPIS